MMKRVLFVDDDQNVLQGLRRMLRPMRNEWEMAFADGGQDALALLAKEPFDVVVSDMRMPGMDGAELLERVREHYPKTVRIVLSGHAEYETVMKLIGPTHQYLAKPADADKIRDTIARALALREMMHSDAVQNTVASIPSLPSIPETYREVVSELSAAEPSLKRVGDIISGDVAMTAKILQLINSAFFGFPRHVGSVHEAVNLLGMKTIQSLVLAHGAFRSFEGALPPGFSIRALTDHSMYVASLAKRICKAEECSNSMCEDAFMAGLLHDIGKLVLAAHFPTEYGQAMALTTAGEVSVLQAEMQVLGVGHCMAGAYLLGLWGMNDLVVEVLAHHHAPSASVGDSFGALAAVYAANMLAHETAPNGGGQTGQTWDLTYLRRLDIADRVEAWRAISRDFDGSESE